MALFRTGGSTVKSVKPILANPSFILPSSVNLQVRHAARKGYREKARKKKQAQAEEASSDKRELTILKKKYTTIEKTVNLKKPEPPPDDVFIKDLFNHKKYSLAEVIQFHREYHHPEVYNNPNPPVSLKIEIDMTKNTKGTQFLKPFHGVASIPHPFVISYEKQVLVLCDPEHVNLALESGAEIAGGVDLVKKIKEGVIQPSLYEYVITHSNFLSQITPIRSILKDQMPRGKIGTLTTDLKSAIYRFRHGIEYSCLKMGNENDFGFIDCAIGTLNMDVNHLEENLQALIKDIEKNRPPRDGEFIRWIWCTSKPSDEEFSLDLSKYVKADLGEDEKEAVAEQQEEEKMAAKN